MKNLKDSVAVVTGGASGIGFALAKGAQSRGAKIVISDVREDALADAAAQLAETGEVLAVKADVSKFGEHPTTLEYSRSWLETANTHKRLKRV